MNGRPRKAGCCVCLPALDSDLQLGSDLLVTCRCIGCKITSEVDDEEISVWFRQISVRCNEITRCATSTGDGVTAVRGRGMFEGSRGVGANVDEVCWTRHRLEACLQGERRTGLGWCSGNADGATRKNSSSVTPALSSLSLTLSKTADSESSAALFRPAGRNLGKAAASPLSVLGPEASPRFIGGGIWATSVIPGSGDVTVNADLLRNDDKAPESKAANFLEIASLSSAVGGGVAMLLRFSIGTDRPVSILAIVLSVVDCTVARKTAVMSRRLRW